MKTFKINGIDFNATLAASMDEAAFVDTFTDMAIGIWYKDSPTDVVQRLHVAYKIMKDMAEPTTVITAAPKPTGDDNGSRTTEEIPGGGSGGSAGGGSDGEPADVTKPKRRAANARPEQEGGEDRKV